jgi:predicted dehydrogenase
VGGVRWAVVGTGSAARAFTVGLRSARGHDVAVVGSRVALRGRAFADSLGLTASVLEPMDAVGSDVDAVYIATPPATHVSLALAALAAGRPILVEKPFASTAQDAERMVAEARSRGVFGMEAMWTHFLPLPRRVASLVSDGALGELTGITASFGLARAGSPHLLDPDLGGGALLDRGVYAVSYAVRALGEPDEVEAAVLLGPTGVDLDCVLLLRYSVALVTVSASLRAELANDVWYTGTSGRLHVRAPIYRPVSAMLQARPPTEELPEAGRSRGLAGVLGQTGIGHGARQVYTALTPQVLQGRARPIWRPYRGNGYHYQALEVARCLSRGLTESSVMPLADTLATMRTVDRARIAWARTPAGQRLEGGTR